MNALSVQGAEGPITVRLDTYGIPHVDAGSITEAMIGMGFAAAQGRLWQMEYDRRRATGRWSEVVGPSGWASDVLSRRLRLTDAAKRDIDVMSSETRAAFEAYSRGVNVFLTSGIPLPPEYALCGLEPEPWEPWHSVAVYKIRHVLMGHWQMKLAHAELLTRVGPETFAQLGVHSGEGTVVTVPPGARVTRVFKEASEEIERAARDLGFLSEVEAGSNAWVVHGSRTTTGKPVLCNDSHRLLDVPNAYWQVHVRCPDFDASGGTFPGLPGFPHFGHTAHVAWAITHAHADYQDLYIEEFDPAHPERYRTPEGWAEADRRVEEVCVRGEEPRTLETWATGHGPVVHGEPGSGHALSLRYTATDRPCRGFEPLLPMLFARTVEDLLESQREWVDPVNNFLAADVDGNIAYLTRGLVPLRSGHGHRRLPVPGWTGENEWIGFVPFEKMPRSVNPPEGFLATSNQTIVDDIDLYISHTYSDPFRAERLVQVLAERSSGSPDEIASIQGDSVSLAARAWIKLFRSIDTLEGTAEQARAMLVGWNGNVAAGSGPALLYGYFRRAMGRALFQPMVGEKTWAWLASGIMPPTSLMISHWLAHFLWEADTDPGGSAAATLRQRLPEALESAWRAATQYNGTDLSRWQWGDRHRTNAVHTLAASSPAVAGSCSLPRMGVGGDGDTILRGSYRWKEEADFAVVGLPIYRQVVNLADPGRSTYVIPGGASGDPTSGHFADQLQLWALNLRIPMYWREDDVQTWTVLEVTLQPDT